MAGAAQLPLSSTIDFSNQMVPVDDNDPEGPKEKRAAHLQRVSVKAKIEGAAAAVSPEELAIFRAMWLAEAGGVQPMNDRQLIKFGMHMLKNPR